MICKPENVVVVVELYSTSPWMQQYVLRIIIMGHNQALDISSYSRKNPKKNNMKLYILFETMNVLIQQKFCRYI